MSGKPDPFAALRDMDEEEVAEARAREDEWGAMVRVADDLAHDKHPAQKDCERLGLPYDPGESFERVTVPTNPTAEQPAREPTRAQVRPLARLVVGWLCEREE